MKLFTSLLLLFTTIALGDTPPARTVNAQLYDAAGNGITSQANGSQRALDVGVNVSGVQVDPRAIRTLTTTDQVSTTTIRASLTYNAPTSVSVGVASTATVASNAARKGLSLINISANIVSCAVGTAAILNSGITLNSWGNWEMKENDFTTGAINCIASAAASSVAIQERQ